MIDVPSGEVGYHARWKRRKALKIMQNEIMKMLRNVIRGSLVLQESDETRHVVHSNVSFIQQVAIMDFFGGLYVTGLIRSPIYLPR